MNRVFLRRLGALFGLFVLDSLIYGSALPNGSEYTPLMIIAGIISGTVGIFRGPVPASQAFRFFKWSAAGVFLVAFLEIALSPSFGRTGYVMGVALSAWLMAGGSSALIVSALPRLRE